MLVLVRIALQAVLFFLLLGVAMALGDVNVGVFEKVVAGVLGVLLIAAAWWVRRLGRAPPAF